jgi:hypothetical protein
MKSVSCALCAVACGILLGCSGSGGGLGRDGGGAGPIFSTGSGSSSGGSTDMGGTTSSSGGQGSAGVSLVVDSVSAPASIDGIGPSSGSFFVVVDMTLKNTGASMALPVSGVFFSLETTQNLIISSSPDQASNACSASVSVASGGQNECQIVFEVPTGQTPATLKYDDLRGDTASASIPAVPVPSAACETWIGWITSTSASSACDSCIRANEGSTGPCAAAGQAYHDGCTADGGGAAQCASTLDQVCSCELTADDATCRSLFDAEMRCIVSSCTSTCP